MSLLRRYTYPTNPRNRVALIMSESWEKEELCLRAAHRGAIQDPKNAAKTSTPTGYSFEEVKSYIRTARNNLVKNFEGKRA
jgi:hypothetical protein